jgi:hypothetical protein
MRNRLDRRLVYVATIVSLLGVTGGMAIAAGILSATNVNQGASFYEGGNSGANGYGTATLQVATTPAAVTTCSTSAVTGGTSAGTVNLFLSSTSGSTTCTTGNFAEEFSVSFSATIATQTNTFTITTQVGAGAVQTNSQQVVLGTGTSGAFTQTVDVFVDYGTVQPPAAGITVLDLVIQ